MVQPHPHHSLREEEFDLNFGNQLRVRRITEYCQWSEVLFFKFNRVNVIGEECWRNCFVWERLGWSPVLLKRLYTICSISSDDFVDEKHHVNIDRDPFPSRVSVPRRILIGSYVVDPPFFNHTVDTSNAGFMLLAHFHKSLWGDEFFHTIRSI